MPETWHRLHNQLQIFDGTVLHPNESLLLEPNTQVKMTIETIPPANQDANIFLDTAQSLNLDGPPDWSTNLDTYLYGEKSNMNLRRSYPIEISPSGL